MLDPFNPYDPWMLPLDPHAKDPFEGMSEQDRIQMAIRQACAFIVFFIIALAVMGVASLFTGCATPKQIEEHHHHHYEADTAAVSAQVDSRLTSWHQQMERHFAERLEQISSQMSSQSQEHEVTTETVTTATDSLGREIRTEQRRTERTLSQQQQQLEQRITRDYEARLATAIDSINDIWSQRYDSLSARVAQADSSSLQKTPVGDTRPWYQHWWDNLKTIAVVLLFAAFFWITRRIWLPLLKKR